MIGKRRAAEGCRASLRGLAIDVRHADHLQVARFNRGCVVAAEHIGADADYRESHVPSVPVARPRLSPARGRTRAASGDAAEMQSRAPESRDATSFPTR